MSRGRFYSFVGVVMIVSITMFFQNSNNQKSDFSETVKVSLRDVGDKLLLLNQDSTSLVLPVTELETDVFKLSFKSSLSFEPSDLVSIVEQSFSKLGLPKSYIVEVVQCLNKEVAYSYKMTTNEQTTIIPCSGRVLPKSCYTIEVKFIGSSNTFMSQSLPLYLLVLVLLMFLTYLLYSRRKVTDKTEEVEGHTKIGSFEFYPEQNKLVKSAVEINLSRKECELLSIFVTNTNRVVKRGELTKRVWEDNGVIVGRSLDTYISKLRTKLKSDKTVKLTNVHGIGYKLEINTP